MACAKLGITTLGIYHDYSTEWLEKIINTAELHYICCSSEYLLKVLTMKQANKIPTVEIIFCLQKPNHEALHVLANLGNVKIIYYREKSNVSEDFIENNMEKIYTLAQTSGVTSEQKFCMISYRNMLMSIFGADIPGLNLEKNDVYISFVPLSLLWERVIMYKVILSGASIGFSDRDKSIITENILILKPSLVLGVPMLLEEIYDKIQTGISELSSTKRAFFHKAYSAKLKAYKKNKKLTSTILDKFIFKTIRNKTGGRIRLMIIGSAVYRPGIVEFLRLVLSCDILEGYGSTETSIACFCSIPGDNVLGHVGGPLPGVLVKMRKMPKMNFEGFEGKMVGELYVKGEKLCKGYFKGPEFGAEHDGWMPTGDVFAYNSFNGSFTFIDILQCIEVLGNSKSISLQRLECLYKTSLFVKQILIKYRNDKLIALVVPNEEYITSSMAPGFVKFSEVCETSLLVSTVMNDFNRIAKNMDLKYYEKINKVFLEPISWESDEVFAPALKLKRGVLESRYDEIIQRLSLET